MKTWAMTKWLPLAITLAIAAPAIAQSAADLPDRPIARAEVIATVKAQFAALDANHDGIVTAAEFNAYRARPHADPAGNPFAHIGGHWFAHADAAGDGRVTLAEAEARPLRLFDLADVDKDGIVSPSERQVAMALMALGGK